MEKIRRHSPMLAGVIFISIHMVASAAMITDVVAKQRYPWNGLVDITCNVSGITDADKGKVFQLSAIVPDTGETMNVSNLCVIINGDKSSSRSVTTNGAYNLLWDATADIGQVRYTNMIVRVEIVDRPKVQLWEGGPCWATTNIGAENPEDYGYYFWWGDTVGYKRENDKWVASDGSSLNFSFAPGNTPTYYRSNSALQSEGWITADGVLTSEHDAAHIHWGGDWRMPTEDEFGALNSNCDWIWTTQNGVNGYVVRGRGDYADNSIFLPCAGYGLGTSLYNTGSYGYYWSSVPRSDGYNAWGLRFLSGYPGTYDNSRYFGQSVRPVQGFIK